jgi:transposase
VDLENKDYGEYAVVLACTKGVLDELQNHFHPEDAIRMYALSIIYFIEEYTPASYCGDLFRQSILSDKWSTLSFSEDTINSFLKDIGQHGLMCERYSQSLIDQSSELTALDGHVIMSNSQQNELAEYGYKYRELKDKQINIMGAYDAENNRQLVSKAMRGSLPDKLSVQELFVAFKFRKKTFLADSGFYSEENMGYFRSDNNQYIIPVPDTYIIAKIIKENITFTDSFVYEHVESDGSRSQRVIMYRESTVAELEALDDKKKEEKARQKNEKEKENSKNGEKIKKYYPNYNKKSKWGNDRVIIYRDQTMHDRLVYDYRSQIGIDEKHTEEELQRLETFFGIIVLRVSESKQKLSPKEAYLKYKKRWSIETHYNFVSNIVRFDGLQTQDYYTMQGLSFLVLLVGQIKKYYTDKLRASSSKYVRNMSLKESIVKAKFIKTSKHIDNKWHVSVLNNKSIELLVEMGVNIEEDLIALNKGNY